MIPKNATYHGLQAILEMYRTGNDHKYCLHGIRQYLSKLGRLKITDASFNKDDREYLLNSVDCVEDFQTYLQSKTEVEIEWLDDDFYARPIYGRYEQKKKSWLMLTDALRGGVNRSAISSAMRCVADDTDQYGYPLSKAMVDLVGNSGKVKLGKQYGVKEHRFPMNEMVDYLAEKVFDIRHMARVMNKHHQVWWVTNEENQRLDDAGYKQTRPTDGTDRYDAVGILV